MRQCETHTAPSCDDCADHGMGYVFRDGCVLYLCDRHLAVW